MIKVYLSWIYLEDTKTLLYQGNRKVLAETQTYGFTTIKFLTFCRPFYPNFPNQSLMMTLSLISSSRPMVWFGNFLKNSFTYSSRRYPLKTIREIRTMKNLSAAAGVLIGLITLYPLFTHLHAPYPTKPRVSYPAKRWLNSHCLGLALLYDHLVSYRCSL